MKIIQESPSSIGWGGSSSDLEAALEAEELRESTADQGKDFTFETVLSTDGNLKLLKKAKEKGIF